jgi:hypothetical protein
MPSKVYSAAVVGVEASGASLSKMSPVGIKAINFNVAAGRCRRC